MLLPKAVSYWTPPPGTRESCRRLRINSFSSGEMSCRWTKPSGTIPSRTTRSFASHLLCLTSIQRNSVARHSERLYMT